MVELTSVLSNKHLLRDISGSNFLIMFIDTLILRGVIDYIFFLHSDIVTIKNSFYFDNF